MSEPKIRRRRSACSSEAVLDAKQRESRSEPIAKSRATSASSPEPSGENTCRALAPLQAGPGFDQELPGSPSTPQATAQAVDAQRIAGRPVAGDLRAHTLQDLARRTQGALPAPEPEEPVVWVGIGTEDIELRQQQLRRAALLHATPLHIDGAKLRALVLEISYDSSADPLCYKRHSGLVHARGSWYRAIDGCHQPRDERLGADPLAQLQQATQALELEEGIPVLRCEVHGEFQALPSLAEMEVGAQRVHEDSRTLTPDLAALWHFSDSPSEGVHRSVGPTFAAVFQRNQCGPEPPCSGVQLQGVEGGVLCGL
eukprot:CAMPEP_0171121024 /NCGR_PEP_ID=MMETSP0766_2-20121228/101298_1 /TAXON_ID=439317 /ORGANISM="Gambierdiscus australes, Strain CAWD 149" /LENGTH=312 /DNA_ID=CAMNT_0011583785 /DNA_START=144 /DNA_END=1081 /DNA_ORIENTATION=+